MFAAIPVIATYILGHIFKFVFQDDFDSIANMPLDDPDRMMLPIVEYIFPFAILCGCLAFVIWVMLMKSKPTKGRGIIAGLVTVFLAYPVLGFAIGLIYPDLVSRIRSAISNAFLLTFMGNIMTFWLTYPMGAICGGLIAKRMIANMDETAEVFT